MQKFITTLSLIVCVGLIACHSTSTNDKYASTNIKDSTNTNSNNLQNHLEVYVFHGTRQCTTCKNLKSNTKTTLEKFFSNELQNNQISFQIIDVDDPANEQLAEKFQATGTALILNKVKNGKDSIIDLSDFAFDKANDVEAFVPELKTKISTLLK